MAADGEHTIREFVERMGAQYEGGAPAGLQDQIESIVSDLTREGILRVHDVPTPLPTYFAEEYFAQPQEVRQAQMRADGLTTRPRA